MIELNSLSSKIYRWLLKTRFRNILITKVLLNIADFVDHKFGEYSNSRNGNTNDHLVPQLLLKGFKSDDPSFNNCTYVYYKSQKLISNKPKSISKDIASKLNFYDFRDKSGNPSDYIDQKIFRRHEVNFSKLIFNFEPKLKSGLTYFEEIVLNNFISYQIIRAEFFRNCIETYLHYLLTQKFITKEELNIDLLFEKVLHNKFGLSSDGLINYKKIVEPKIIEGEKAKGFITDFCLRMGDPIAQSIWGKSCLLIKAPSAHVIISDNPIITFDSTGGISEFIDWWNLRQKQILFPISHSELLFIAERVPHYPIEDNYEAGRNFVSLNNFGQFLTAHDEVYGKDRSILEMYKQKFQV